MTKEEYMRLRRVAIKRMKRLQKAGLSKHLRQNYAYGRAFPSYSKIKGNMNTRKFLKASRKLEAFLATKGSTVSGARDIQKKTLQTIEAISDKEFRTATPKIKALFKEKQESFGLFMKAAKEAMGDAAFDSDRAVTAYKLAQKNGLDTQRIAKAFDDWQKKNLDKKIQKRKTQVTDEQLERMLSGDAGSGNNRVQKRDRSNVKKTNGRSAGRTESRAQKKKRKRLL